MKTFLSIALLFPLLTFSQSKFIIDDLSKTGLSLKIDSIRNSDINLIKSQAFNKLVDKDFRYLIGNTNRRNPYVSQIFVDITQPNINLNTQGIPIIPKIHNNPLNLGYLSFDVKAGISDGVSALFKNNKLNTGISGNANWNVLLFNRYFFLEEERSKLNAKKKDLIDKLIRERNNNIFILLSTRSLLAKLNFEIKQLNEQLRIPDTTSISYFEKLGKYYQLKSAINNNEIKEDSLYKEIDSDKNWTEKVAKKVTDFEIDNAVFDSKAIGWITGFLGLESIKYNIFYPDSIFSKQVSPSYFRGVNRGIRFNFLSLSSTSWWFNGFASIGYKKGLEDNIGRFSKWEVTTNQDFGSQNGNAKLSRSIEQKGTVLLASPEILKSGGYITNQFQTLQLQFIKYLDFERHFGVSMVYDRKFLKKESNNLNFEDIEFGLLFQGTDKKDEKVNYYITLYLTFYDLMNTGENKRDNGTLTKWQERNEIGIKVGLPFNTLKLKK